MLEHNTKLEADEIKVTIGAKMRIANLKDGGRRITHPTGRVCIETPEQIMKERKLLEEAVVEAQKQLNAYKVEFGNG